jgi:hypothetical protein
VAEHRQLVLIIGLYLVLGIGYSLLMPIWEAPDERAHYGYILTIVRSGEGPSNAQNYESFQPPLYYWISGLPVRIIEEVEPAWVRPLLPPRLPAGENVPRYDWNSENYRFLLAPLVVRWMGLVFGGMALYSIFRGVQTVFPGEPGVSLGVIALAGGIPQFIHITASVSNDTLAILSGGLIFLALADVCRREDFARSWFLYGGAALLLPVLVKLTVLPVAVALLAAILVRTRRLRPRRTARYLAIAAGLAAAAFILFFLFFPGAFDRFIQEAQFRLLTFRPGLGDVSIQRVVGRYLWNFWGKVGWLSVGIPLGAVVVLTLASAAGMGFGTWSLFNSRDDETVPAPARRLLAWSSFAAAVALLMLFVNYLSTPQLQGRFLFPTLGPIALLVVFGWRRLLAERARFLLPALVFVMLALNLQLWLTGVIPVYYQPFLDP